MDGDRTSSLDPPTTRSALCLTISCQPTVTLAPRRTMPALPYPSIAHSQGYYRCMATEAKTDTASPEKRRWRRFHFAVPVRVTIEKPQHLTLTDARGWRMNNGGTAVYVDTELSIGSEAEIAFTPPHFYPPVTLRGVIRNREGDLYGVEFLAKSAADNEELALFRQILARWAAAAW
jgi:hypothetical protein